MQSEAALSSAKAAVPLMETEENALEARGATIYAELASTSGQ